MNGDTSGVIKFLKDQLSKPATDSKKYLAAMVGMGGVILMFGVSSAMVLLAPASAAVMPGIVQMAMTTWSGIVVAYLGVQGATDFKATSALGSEVEKK
jgi:hypothetical protein